MNRHSRRKRMHNQTNRQVTLEHVVGVNEYRIVKQENYMLHDGIHEGIISETDWELAHQKREKTGVKYEKTHSLEHEHILSGISVSYTHLMDCICKRPIESCSGSACTG